MQHGGVYENRLFAANKGTGEYLVITADGKGVAMRREDLRPGTARPLASSVRKPCAVGPVATDC